MLQAKVSWREPSSLFPVFGLVLFYAAMVFYASVMEDGYITLRVADNFVHGEGLRWNLDERVQVYTHPLWLLLLIPFYAVWPDAFPLVLTLSALLSMGMVLLVLHTLRRPPLLALCLFLLPLTLSKSFMMFCTSGFENPLTHLLLAWFLHLLWRGTPKYWWFWLGLSTALALLTRLDMLVLYVPAWGWLLWRHRRQVRVWQVLAGGAPLLAWCVFSLFYYGFVFPNTKYAKLDTGIAAADYIRSGWHYFLNLAVMDPVSFIVLLAGMAMGPALAWRWWHEKQDKDAVLLALLAGVLLHALYTVSVGGTYLTGRFTTADMMTCAWVLLAAVRRPRRQLLVLPLLLFALRPFYVSEAFVLERCPACLDGVGYARAGDKVSLRAVLSGKRKPPVPRSLVIPEAIIVAGSMGQWPFMLERKVIVIDFIGITDPLLARLPSNIAYMYSTGNIPRDVPAGYVHARGSGDVSRMEPDIGAYYRKLRFVVSGELWSMARLREIWRFNRGDYDALLAAYADRVRPR